MVVAYPAWFLDACTRLYNAIPGRLDGWFVGQMVGWLVPLSFFVVNRRVLHYCSSPNACFSLSTVPAHPYETSVQQWEKHDNLASGCLLQTCRWPFFSFCSFFISVGLHLEGASQTAEKILFLSRTNPWSLFSHQSTTFLFYLVIHTETECIM